MRHITSSAEVRRTAKCDSRGYPERRAKIALITPPTAEHCNGVEQAAVVCSALAVLVEDPLHFVRVEEPRARRTGRQPRFMGEVAEPSGEPIRQRHLEAQLW